MTNKRNLPVLTDEEMAEKIRKSIENGERRMKLSDKCLYALRGCVQKTIRLQKRGTRPHANASTEYHNALVEAEIILTEEMRRRNSEESEEPRPYLTFPSAEEYEEIED